MKVIKINPVKDAPMYGDAPLSVTRLTPN